VARLLFLLLLLSGCDYSPGPSDDVAALGDVDTEEDDTEDGMLPAPWQAPVRIAVLPSGRDARPMVGLDPAPPLVPPPIVA
jgi:hypothetical protein